MPEAIGHIGPHYVIWTYTVIVSAAALAALLWIGAQGARQQGAAVPWLDAALLALAGAVVGGRLLFAALNYRYFAQNPGHILRLGQGGMEWHGALVGGLVGGRLGCRLRGVDWSRLADAAALALPLVGAAVWLGCISIGCGAGAEVPTLAGRSPLLVVERRDLYGLVAPRYNTQGLGLAWSAVGALVLGGVAALDWLRGARLPLAIMWLAGGACALGFGRGDFAPYLAGLRLDQWLDLATAPAGAVWLYAAVSRRQSDATR